MLVHLSLARARSLGTSCPFSYTCLAGISRHHTIVIERALTGCMSATILSRVIQRVATTCQICGHLKFIILASSVLRTRLLLLIQVSKGLVIENLLLLLG
jgi:hypothetical protein